MKSENIQENTVDIEAHVYSNPHNADYRWSVRPDADHPGSVNLSYEEVEFYDNHTRCRYEKKGVIGFDKDEWQKIKYAIEAVFEKTI